MEVEEAVDLDAVVVVEAEVNVVDILVDRQEGNRGVGQGVVEVTSDVRFGLQHKKCLDRTENLKQFNVRNLSLCRSSYSGWTVCANCDSAECSLTRRGTDRQGAH